MADYYTPEDEKKPLSYGQQMANVGQAFKNAALAMVSAPGYGLNAPAADAAQTAPAGAQDTMNKVPVISGPPTYAAGAGPDLAPQNRPLPAGVPESTAGAGRGTVNPTLAGAPNPAAAATPTVGGFAGAPVAGADGARRIGNLYTNVPGENLGFNGARGGMGANDQGAPQALAQLSGPSARNANAADALSEKYAMPARAAFAAAQQPSGPSMTILPDTWVGANANYMAMPKAGSDFFASRDLSSQQRVQQESDREKTAAGREASQLQSQTQLATNAATVGAQREGNQMQYGVAQQNAQTAANRLAAELPGMQAHAGLYGAQTETAKTTAEGAKQLQALNTTYLAALQKGDTEAANKAAGAIMALQGKAEPAAYHFTPVSAGVDQTTGMPVGQALVRGNTRTGEYSVIPPGGGQQHPPMPTDKSKLVQGTVYETPQGRGRWDGTKFIRVQ